MTTFTNKKLCSAQQITNAAATYYTVPANTTAILKRLTFVNTSAGAVTVTFYLIASGGSAGDSNTYVKARTLAVSETWAPSEIENITMSAADFIQAKSDTNTAVTIHLSGIEVT